MSKLRPCSPWFWTACSKPPTHRRSTCFFYIFFWKCRGCEWKPRRSAPTALLATDNYLAMISEGAVKTGSAGNAVGSPAFSPPEGGFLTGEIIQRDRSSGQARADRWTQLGGCLQVVPLAAIRVQTANRVVKCRGGTCNVGPEELLFYLWTDTFIIKLGRFLRGRADRR